MILLSVTEHVSVSYLIMPSFFLKNTGTLHWKLNGDENIKRNESWIKAYA